MSHESAWSVYLTARNQHLATHERMADRTRSTATPVEPRNLAQSDLEAWLALLREEEAALRAHREAFELYFYERIGVPTPQPG